MHPSHPRPPRHPQHPGHWSQESPLRPQQVSTDMHHRTRAVSWYFAVTGKILPMISKQTLTSTTWTLILRPSSVKIMATGMWVILLVRPSDFTVCYFSLTTWTPTTFSRSWTPVQVTSPPRRPRARALREAGRGAQPRKRISSLCLTEARRPPSSESEVLEANFYTALLDNIQHFTRTLEMTFLYWVLCSNLSCFKSFLSEVKKG